MLRAEKRRKASGEGSVKVEGISRKKGKSESLGSPLAGDHAVVSRCEPTARMEGLPVAISMRKEASHMARASGIMKSSGGSRSMQRTKNGRTRVGFGIKKECAMGPIPLSGSKVKGRRTIPVRLHSSILN